MRELANDRHIRVLAPPLPARGWLTPLVHSLLLTSSSDHTYSNNVFSLYSLTSDSLYMLFPTFFRISKLSYIVLLSFHLNPNRSFRPRIFLQLWYPSSCGNAK